MSAFTRANAGNVVVFKDRAGHEVTGVVLFFRSTYALVGVTSQRQPTVTVRRHSREGIGYDRQVPNNSVWAVPFENIIRTELASTAAE